MEKLAKENGLLHYNLGVIYTEKESYAEALKEFEKALELRPDDGYSHYNLGIIYSQYVIDEDKAVDHFKKYLKIAPSDKDADMARKYVFVRESYNAKGK
jgi:tetratricopeptide (TPR) repeat protein